MLGVAASAETGIRLSSITRASKSEIMRFFMLVFSFKSIFVYPKEKSLHHHSGTGLLIKKGQTTPLVYDSGGPGDGRCPAERPRI